MRKTVLICGLALAITAPSNQTFADKAPEPSFDQFQPGEVLILKRCIEISKNNEDTAVERGIVIAIGIGMGFFNSNERAKEREKKKKC